jgi:hypothetical protein
MSKHINTPGKKNKAGKRPQDAPANENDPAEGKPLSVPHVPPAPANTNQPKQPWYKSLERWKIIAELVAIPFAIAYAIVTYFQWGDLRHNFAVDQRAWLKCELIEQRMDLRTAKIARAPVVVTNIGKSPAMHATVQGAVEIVDKDKAPAFDYAGPPAPTYFPIFYQTDRQESLIYALEGEGSPKLGHAVTDTERNLLIEGSACVAIYGTVTYNDQFGMHWVQFCRWQPYAASTCRMGSCTRYNMVGDGIPPTKPPKE